MEDIRLTITDKALDIACEKIFKVHGCPNSLSCVYATTGGVKCNGNCWKTLLLEMAYQEHERGGL